MTRKRNYTAVLKVNKKKLSCRSQAARASCKVIRNYTDEYDVCLYAYFYTMGRKIAPFLPRDAMHKRGLCRRAASVCPSVRHVRVFCRNEKNVSSKFFHRRV